MDLEEDLKEDLKVSMIHEFWLVNELSKHMDE